MNDFPRFLKTLAVAALIALMALTLARKSDAGQFSTLIAVAIDVANSEAQTAAAATVRSGPILPLIKERPKLTQHRTAQQTVTVCDASGCRKVVVEGEAPSPAPANRCPCDCSYCTCNQASAAAPQRSATVYAAPRILERQPVRSTGRAVARTTGRAVRAACRGAVVVTGKAIRATGRVAAAPVRAVRDNPGPLRRAIFAPQRPRLFSGRLLGRRCR